MKSQEDCNGLIRLGVALQLQPLVKHCILCAINPVQTISVTTNLHKQHINQGFDLANISQDTAVN